MNFGDLAILKILQESIFAVAYFRGSIKESKSEVLAKNREFSNLKKNFPRGRTKNSGISFMKP